jgi:ferrochelatase
MRSFPGIPHSLSWQSRAGRQPWLSPDTVDEVTRLAAEGVRHLVVVPVSFVSDHIETLHELDIRLSSHAKEMGIQSFHRASALNDSPPFIEALKPIVMEAM